MGDRQSSQRAKRRVLVIDDDPGVIQILEANLAHANFEVIPARNGTQGLTQALRERPDLILLDVILPDLDGLDVCRRLKERQPTSHIPVIIISAKVRDEDRIAGITAGAEDYITKPFDPGEVVAIVESSLQRFDQQKTVHPLTGLPNRTQINSEISARIKQNEPFAAIYVDIDLLQTFNKRYGYGQGDRVIQLLGEILREEVRLFGNPDDLVGHLDDDDFVVVSTPQKASVLCQRMVTDFDSRIKTLYDPEDIERGYIELESRLGQQEQYPIMTISAAVITNEKRAFDHRLQVSEVAAELKIYLKRLSGSNYYFDRRSNGNGTKPSHPPGSVPPVRREELKAMQGVLAWVAFLARELETRITIIKDWLESLPKGRLRIVMPGKADSLGAVKESASQLLHLMKGLENLRHDGYGVDGASLDEVELAEVLDWVMAEVEWLVKKQDIRVEVEGVEAVGRVMVDGRSLAQGLFYLLRNEVESSSPGDRVLVRLSATSEAFITIEIINRNHHIPPDELATLFRGELDNMMDRGRKNDLYLARVLVQGLGGKLQVKSQEEEGTVFHILVPKRWQSFVEQINHLQSSLETSSQATQGQFKNINYLLSTAIEPVPPAVEESLANLSAKVQELEVLCNRSLFLADDLTSEMDRRENQLLQQEVEQLATSEAILTISREIARLTPAAHLFDQESAQRVAKNALAITNEFKLSKSEQRTIYYAALLKDLGLAAVPQETLEQKLAITPKQAGNLRESLNNVRQALSRLNFLAPAISVLLHMHERYDGTGYPSGLRGTNIPLGAKILAVASAFEAMTSDRSTQKIIDPETLAKELAADAGQRFDPQVVSVFLQSWRKERISVKPPG